MTISPEPLTKSNFVDELARAFPELEDAARLEASRWVDDGLSISVHQVVLQSFLAPALEPLLTKGQARTPDDELLLTRMFVFVERMACSPDDEVSDAAETEVVEGIAPRRELDRLLPLLGAQTRAWVDAHRR